MNMKHKAESSRKAFCRLMFAGKIRQATKFIDNCDKVHGVHSISEEIIEALAKKHPKAEELYPDAMLSTTRPLPNPVVYEQITTRLQQRLSKDQAKTSAALGVQHWLTRMHGNIFSTAVRMIN